MLRKHWRKLLALLSLLVVFGAGRLTAPPPPPEVRIEERVVYKDRIVEVLKTVEVQAKAQRTVVYRDRVIKPDGTRIEREVERSAAETTVTSATSSTTEKATEASVDHKTTIVPQSPPDWRVSALAGVGFGGTGVAFVSPVLGVVVERRIFGPVSAGAWALNSGSGGLALSVEF